MNKVEIAKLKFKGRFVKGVSILIIGCILNVLETWASGWHRTASCTLEFLMDFTTLAIMVYGWCFISTSKMVINIDLSEFANENSLSDILEGVNDNEKGTNDREESRQ